MHISVGLRALLVMLVLFMTQPAIAIETDKAAHFGIAFAATQVTYGAFKSIFGSHYKLERHDKIVLAIFSAAVVNLLGVVKEIGDSQPDGKDLLANGLGSTAAGLTILTFDF